MTINRPTLNEQKQVRQALRAEKHPAALGALVGLLLVVLIVNAFASLVVFSCLNLIGGFGLSFGKIVGLGLLLGGLHQAIARSD